MKDKIYVVTKAIIYGQLMLEAMDEVKDLPIFKYSLKRKINQAEQELEKELGKYIMTLTKKDEEFYYNLQTHIEDLITKLSKLSIEELPLVNKIIDEYMKDADNWKKNLTLQFKKLNS